MLSEKKHSDKKYVYTTTTISKVANSITNSKIHIIKADFVLLLTSPLNKINIDNNIDILHNLYIQL